MRRFGRPSVNLPRAAFPTGADYDRLVEKVARYGWVAGAAMDSPVTYQTLHAWRTRAARGDEPYATWIAQFLADYGAARQRLGLPEPDPNGTTGLAGPGGRPERS
jgi:hypothetical protein